MNQEQNANSEPLGAEQETTAAPGGVAPEAGRLSRPKAVLLIALGLAVITDLIVYQQRLGAQWAIFVNILLVGSCAAALLEGRRIRWQTGAVAALVGLSAGLTVFRLEEFTLLSLVFFSIGGLLILGMSFVSGQWPALRFRDYFTRFFRLLGSVLGGIFTSLAEGLKQRQVSEDDGSQVKKARKGSAVARGVLMAVPLVLIFGLLLSSADLVFGQKVKALFSSVRLDNWQDILKQFVWIAIFTYLIFGYIRTALVLGAERANLEPDSALIQPFLGFTEASIVLVSLNLLFGAFLLIQFRYFFAGEANITAAGFTYADYARRGFFELIGVAVLSSLVIFALASLSKREKKGYAVVFTILETVLILQVGVMLFSALQRLNLYEAAYGFTQARLAAHIFMFFLAAFLLVLLILESRRQFKRLAFVIVIFAAAFALTLAVVNVDVTVTRNNLKHALQGHELDVPFLVYSVSDDAAGVMFAALEDPATPSELKASLGLALACRAERFGESAVDAQSWPAWHASRASAERLYTSKALLLENYPLYEDQDGLWFMIDGQEYYCFSTGGLD